MVHHNGRWLLYVRANLQFYGSRFTQVAESEGGDVTGPYRAFRTLNLAGWDERSASGNLYFTAVTPHVRRTWWRLTRLA